MTQNRESRGSGTDAINDPDVLWAVIEGLLARLTAIPDTGGIEADPIVYVLAGDRSHHRHPHCPLLVEAQEGVASRLGRPGVRRTVRSGATRAGLAECRACRTHRPDQQQA